MKRWKIGLAAVLALGIGGLTGCEWEASDDGDYWNNRVAWVNFGGVYRTGAPVSVPVPDPGTGDPGTTPPPGAIGDLRLFSEVVGIGNSVDRTFSGTLAGRPIYPRTLTITDGTESFEDGTGSGILVGDKGGTGAINYSTGVFTVTFLLPPSPGVNVRATYIYFLGEEGEPMPDPDPDPGPGDPDAPPVKVIRRLTVVQDGNVIFMTDGDGDEYRGQMGRVSTAGGDPTGSTSGKVVANFEVTGGGIRIVGAFEGDYTRPDPDSGELYGSLINRRMRGSWFDRAGNTGSIEFSGDQ